jgi:hypothetical protein
VCARWWFATTRSRLESGIIASRPIVENVDLNQRFLLELAVLDAEFEDGKPVRVAEPDLAAAPRAHAPRNDPVGQDRPCKVRARLATPVGSRLRTWFRGIATRDDARHVNRRYRCRPL